VLTRLKDSCIRDMDVLPQERGHLTCQRVLIIPTEKLASLHMPLILHSSSQFGDLGVVVLQ